MYKRQLDPLQLGNVTGLLSVLLFGWRMDKNAQPGPGFRLIQGITIKNNRACIGARKAGGYMYIYIPYIKTLGIYIFIYA